jgi:prolipoprotein diacylglyceryltransferase
MQLWGETRHPSQIYEIIASSVILGLLWFRKTDSPPGTSFLTFTALTSGARVFLEAFRGDSTLVLGGLRVAQIFAWFFLAGSLFLLDKRNKIPAGEVAIRKKE